MITEAVIRDRVGERSFSRGKRYFEQKAIVHPRLEGSTLRARCRGSAPLPYHLWVKMGGEGIIAADCSCPVGDGGYCKHIAALLLTWLHNPESFEEGKPLEKALAEREKADLILLIRQMIARYPDLEEIIELYPAGSGSATTGANADLIRRQIQNTLRYDDYERDYAGAAGIAAELESIMQQADSYRERRAWGDAATVYCTVLDELRETHAEIYDHDGDLNRVFWVGSVGLGECLPQIEQTKIRLNVLHTLVETIIHDIELGGYGFSDIAYDIVLSRTTPEEQARIVSWIEEKIDGSQPRDFSSQWRLEAYGGLLLNLQSETLSNEQFIELCRRTNRLQDLVERLLRLERVGEAVSTATDASDYELLALADLFVAHSHEQIAEDLIWERAGTSNDMRLDNWLQDQAVATGDWRKAIEYASKQFRRRPSLESYREIEEIAEKLGDWSARRERMLAALTDREEYVLLTRIYLHEKNLPASLETLSQMRYGGELAMEVAQLAEESHPREAIRLYREEVDRLIAARGRSNYAQAAVYLGRMKELYEKLQEPAVWQNTIEAVRNHKPRLPALLDELQQAGL